jgi:hypothetical protein
MATETPPRPPGLIGWTADNRGSAGIGLMVAGAAALALPVWMAGQSHWEFLPVIVTTTLFGLLLLGVGVYLEFLPKETGDADRIRSLVLLVTAAGGLLIAATGAALAYVWWSYLPAWLRDDEREGLWRLLVALLVLLGGLAVMFAGLQLARAEERTNPSLRRLVFGYNAGLSVLLLFILLGVANAYVSARFTSAIEAVDRGDTSLSERGLSVAKGLDRPVRFYVLWPTDDDLIYPLRTLLSNLEDASSQIRVQYLSPTLDAQAIKDLSAKYPNKIQEGRGVLVVRGEEKPENATFLPVSDLYTQEGGGRFGEAPQLKFKGEDRVIAALMTERAVVYITQGAGEPDLNDTNPQQLDRGLGVLKQRLDSRGNFDVRPLRIEPADPKIPADAGVVIVANPQPPVGAAMQRALRNYLIDRHGKAIFLLDVPPRGSGEKTVPATGLEGLLGEFGVEVTNERIYSAERLQLGGQVLEDQDFVILQVAADLERSGNELGRVFRRRSLLTRGVRVVRAGRMPVNPMLRPEVLLTTAPGMTVWTETDMTVDPARIAAEIDRNGPAAKRVSPVPLPAAVVVTESAPGGAPGAPPPPAKPRLVVFGDATLATNALVGEGSPSPNFSFFASTLDWLSERPTSVGVGAKSMKYYSLPTTVSGTSLVLLPGVIALVGIVGLGLGVWVVRRR